MSKIVACPVCAEQIAEEKINQHLDDGCLTGKDAQQATPVDLKTQNLQALFNSRFATPRSAATTSKSSGSGASVKRKREHYSPPNTSSKHSSDLGIATPSRTTSEKPSREKRQRSTAHIPLADVARPTALDEVQGHNDLIGKGTLLRSLIEQGKVPSLILWGPPGSGKTTLARIIAKSQNTYYRELSATAHNVADVRKASDDAKNHRALTGQKPIIFLDEIHRFTKSQQDFFLPPVERGDFTLIAATTENPSFRVNNALLSRCRVFVLGKLGEEDMIKVLRRAISFKVGGVEVTVPDKLLAHLAALCDGDARAAINVLEMALDATMNGNPEGSDVTLAEGAIMQALQKSSLLYDRNGEEHYNIISALHKSIRGSDENAALYWLGRMIYAGEDPLYVARRLIRIASEDVGLADNSALPLAISTYHACQIIGMPEADAILGHCVTYLSRAPKSVEVYQALKKVKQTIETTFAYPVPLHIRNAPTKLMKDLDYGKGYKYNPSYMGPVKQTYLPPELEGTDFYAQDNEKLVDMDAIPDERRDGASTVMGPEAEGDGSI